MDCKTYISVWLRNCTLCRPEVANLVFYPAHQAHANVRLPHVTGRKRFQESPADATG